MTILTAKNTPRVSYTASGSQTAFTIPFEFFSVSDIKVYNGTTLLTYEATPSAANKYSIAGTASASDSAYEFGAGGTITLGGSGATAGNIITIIRDISIERTSDFSASGTFDITSLNTDLDKVYAKLADIDQQSDRSVKLLDTDSIAATVTLPAKATRASKVLTFDSDGDVQTTIAATDVTTVAGIASDVTTVSGIASNVTSVVSNASNINTVAGAISNVNTVAGISSNVTSVAGVASLITSDFVSDLNTLATSDIISDLNLVATSDFVSDLNQLATSDFVSDLNALEAIKANVNTVAGISSNVTSVAGNSSNINSAVSNASNINTVAGGITNINTVASNLSSVSSFASIYRIGSSDPSSSLDEGDLFYNSDSNLLKFYNGSAWVGISDASSLITVADESTDTSCNVLFTTGASGNLAPKSGTNLTFNSNTGLLTSTLLASTGLNVDGDATFTGAQYDVVWDKSANSLKFPDNAKAVFGSVPDLSIYHDGSNSVIAETGTGGLAILSSFVQIENAAANETMATFTENGAVSLRFDNTEKFVTTADGVDITSTGSVKVPVGTTAQRNAAPATGDFRFNSTVATFEGYNGSAWGSVGGGATGAGGDTVFQENERVVTTNYTLSTNKSAMCVGPLTINTGVTVTIPSGERLVIL
jgi:hypothetical protein